MRWFKVLLIGSLFLSLSGCATSRKEVGNLQTQQLKMQISELETELQQKDNRISYLEEALKNVQTEKRQTSLKEKKTLTSKAASSQKTSQNVQLALKNAGFYRGPVDGKIGKVTEKAIKQFQKANGLVCDGVVGKKTWARLKKYL